MDYFVNKIYDTIQGEGAYVGTPMTFIRLAGCDVGCSFCDTRESWPLGSNTMTEHEIANEVGQHWVCVTGGEPLQQNIEFLVNALSYWGFKVVLETSGVHPIHPYKAFIEHICVSPKKGYLPDNLRQADSIKWVVSTEVDILEALAAGFLYKSYLQPVSQSPKATQLCVNACLAHGFKLSLQTHKFIGIE